MEFLLHYFVGLGKPFYICTRFAGNVGRISWKKGVLFGAFLLEGKVSSLGNWKYDSVEFEQEPF